jgi:hypothetical protein
MEDSPMLRRSVSVALAAVVLVTTPGLGVFEAAAQVRASAGLPVAPESLAPLTSELPETAGLPASAALPELGTLSSMPGLGAAPIEWEKTAVPVRVKPELLKRLTPQQREDAQAVAAIAEKRVFTYKKIVLELPDTVFDGKSGPIVSLGDLFRAPSSDEVSRLALPRRGFDAAQLTDIRRTATFKVASKDFPGQNHEWRLGPLLQKGSEPTRETFRDHMASGVEQLTVQLPERVSGDRPVSLRRGYENLLRGVERALSLTMGLSERHPKNSENEIRTALQRANAVSIAKTLSLAKVDLALYDAKLTEKAAPILQKIEYNLESKGDSRQEEFYKEVLSNKELEALHPGLGRLLVNRGRAIAMVEEADEAFRQEQRAFAETTRGDLIAANPIRSRVSAWLEKQVKTAVEQREVVTSLSRQYALQARLTKSGLGDEAAILLAELKFQANEAPGIRERLASVLVPNKTFEFKSRIWRKSQWQITPVRDSDGQQKWWRLNKYASYEVPTDIPTWRFGNLFYRYATYTNNATYHLIFSNVINGPLGLRSLVGLREFAGDWDVDQKTGKLVPTGSTGTLVTRIRSLWASRRRILEEHEKKNNYGLFGKGFERLLLVFSADLVRGVIAPLIVLIGQPLLTAVNVSVSAFLAATSWGWGLAASLGVAGFNALVYDTEGTEYNRGGRQSVLSLLPVGLTTAALVAARLLFSWIPYVHLATTIGLAAVGVAAVAVLTKGEGRFLPSVQAAGRSMFGVLEAVVAALAILIAHPAVAAYQFGLGLARTIGRKTWDFLMFHGLIKPFARVPGRDARFMITRVAGPGLSSEYFFQISPDTALVALQASLERARLSSYEAATKARIDEPSAAYAAVTEAIGAALDARMGGSRIEEIAKDQEANHKTLQEAAAPREKLYAALLDLRQGGKIKLRASELEGLLRNGTVLVKNFYKGEFPATEGLAKDDWVGLTERHLASVFGDSILTGLEETDQTLRLKVEAPTLSDYARGLEKGIVPEEAASVDLGRRGPIAPTQPEKPFYGASQILGSRLAK